MGKTWQNHTNNKQHYGKLLPKALLFDVLPVFWRLWGTPIPQQNSPAFLEFAQLKSLFQRVFSRSSDVVAANKVLRHADDGALRQGFVGDLMAVNWCSGKQGGPGADRYKYGVIYTLPKFNTAPEKWWLEDYFPLGW